MIKIYKASVQFQTRQKGLQSNCGPILFVFVCWRHEKRQQSKELLIQSYSGQLLTAPNRSKKLDRLFSPILSNTIKWIWRIGF